MARRTHSLWFSGAASALFACLGTAWADTVPETVGLPQWVLRAQERLALNNVQQRELRLLIDGNSVRLNALQSRFANEASDHSRRAQLEAMAGLQTEFRAKLALILTAEQLGEWDALLEELLGEVHLRYLPRMTGTH